MTRDQADKIIDAVIACRATAREASKTIGGLELRAVFAADDKALHEVMTLISEVTE